MSLLTYKMGKAVSHYMERAEQISSFTPAALIVLRLLRSSLRCLSSYMYDTNLCFTSKHCKVQDGLKKNLCSVARFDERYRMWPFLVPVAVFCTHIDIWSFCPLSADLSFLCNVTWASCLFMFTARNPTVFDYFIVSLKSSQYSPTNSVTLCLAFKARGLAQQFLGYRLTVGVKIWEINSLPCFVLCSMTGFLRVASCHGHFGFSAPWPC